MRNPIIWIVVAIIVLFLFFLVFLPMMQGAAGS